MRVCSTPGCPAIYEGTESRCPTHRKVADRAHWARTRGYNTKGHRQRFRPGVLMRDPVCVLCNVAQSTDADHWPQERTELLELGLDADDPRYGRGLCHSCHSRATAETHGWGTHNN